jgi:HSP20 family protein
MAMADENDNETVEDTGSAEAPASARVEPVERFGLGDLVNWPSWFGSRFPTELFGGFEGIRLEEYRDGNDLVVRGEIPGVDPDNDIEVTVDSGRLTIRAERQSRSESTEDKGYRSEFRYGSFSRVVTLPEGANADDISASYTDGILEVRIPLGTPEAPPATKINVTRG